MLCEFILRQPCFLKRFGGTLIKTRYFKSAIKATVCCRSLIVSKCPGSCTLFCSILQDVTRGMCTQHNINLRLKQSCSARALIWCLMTHLMTTAVVFSRISLLQLRLRIDSNLFNANWKKKTLERIILNIVYNSRFHECMWTSYIWLKSHHSWKNS